MVAFQQNILQSIGRQCILQREGNRVNFHSLISWKFPFPLEKPHFPVNLACLWCVVVTRRLLRRNMKAPWEAPVIWAGSRNWSIINQYFHITFERRELKLLKTTLYFIVQSFNVITLILFVDSLHVGERAFDPLVHVLRAHLFSCNTNSLYRKYSW